MGNLAARTPRTPDATHDAAALVLFDDVQLLLDDLVDDVERGAAAAHACIGSPTGGSGFFRALALTGHPPAVL